ncbi:hypothetical protein EVG20_g5382 [Dentipellis fragilis]|uniref:N-acetyltransferase domain-containing protein n=1 Tax=Dentipellis fragilis TaxID=205917 RepID=A0A4Y9YVG0_9AGAM|nr:hypothetical protein EVG20_g5382 [Dentipellis fragilis]
MSESESESEFSIRPVANLTPAQIDECVSVCIRAYGDDIAVNALVGGDASLRDPFFRSMVNACNADGLVYLALGKLERIAGVGLWVAPGQDLFGTPEKRQACGFDGFWKRLSLEAQKWWTEDYMGGMTKFITEKLVSTGKRKNESFWCSVIATDPDFQRKGIATAHCQALYERAIAENTQIALCATNEQNIKTYVGMGLTVRGRTQIGVPANMETITMPVALLTRG